MGDCTLQWVVLIVGIPVMALGAYFVTTWFIER